MKKLTTVNNFIEEVGLSAKEADYLTRCLSLAKRSKSNAVRFGALVVNTKTGEIAGEGWNRLATAEERQVTKGGYAIHAEQAAILDAMKSGHDVSTDHTVFVLGLSPDEQHIPLRNKDGFFSCVSCSDKFFELDITVNVLSYNGWKEIDPDDAIEQSSKVYSGMEGRSFWKSAPKSGSLKEKPPNIAGYTINWQKFSDLDTIEPSKKNLRGQRSRSPS